MRNNIIVAIICIALALFAVDSHAATLTKEIKLEDGTVILEFDHKVRHVLSKSLHDHIVIFNKLHKVSGVSNYNIKFYTLFENKGKSSYKVKDYIVLTSSTILLYKNDPDYIASVLSHELAHSYIDARLPKLSKYCDRTKARTKICERKADLIGAKIMAKAGYDACKAANRWKIFEKTYGNIESITHPTPRERYNYLRCK